MYNVLNSNCPLKFIKRFESGFILKAMLLDNPGNIFQTKTLYSIRIQTDFFIQINNYTFVKMKNFIIKHK